MINTTIIGFGRGGLRNTEFDMYIPKKMYDASEKRYLTIKEMFELDKACKADGSNYKKYRMEENTPSEILDATREMIARINGTWVDTEEDNEEYEYQKNNPLNWIGEPVPFRLATSFIRLNPFLLE
jgi:putative glycosyltransferase (TIGR04372 family)